MARRVGRSSWFRSGLADSLIVGVAFVSFVTGAFMSLYAPNYSDGVVVFALGTTILSVGFLANSRRRAKVQIVFWPLGAFAAESALVFPVAN